VTIKTPSPRFALYVVAAVLAFGLVPVALAGKGGGTTTSSATLTVNPTSVAWGDSFQGSGCGYTQGKQVNVVVASPSSRTFFPTGVDGNGCIFFTAWSSDRGQYTVSTYQSSNGGKQRLMASASLTVY
jgi:hypothetical protein